MSFNLYYAVLFILLALPCVALAWHIHKQDKKKH